MGQSFYTSIGGIKAAQSQINVVSDNLANMNTIGFKESNITFSDVYYNTLSSGSAAGKSSGGTNPRQIGLGTQVSSIDRNFTNGATQTTGKATDMKIQGNGFFTLINQNDEILYSRAGNFSLDSDGNLVLPNGCRLLGTASTFGTQSGNIPVKIPPIINPTTIPNTVDLGIKNRSDLNNVDITSGTFSIEYTYTSGGVSHTTTAGVSISATDNMNDIVDKIQDALDASNPGCTVSLANGRLNISNPAGSTLSFVSGTSNFVGVTEIGSSPVGGPYATKELDYKQTVAMPDSLASAVKYSGMDIYENGTIEVKYSNGDKLTVVQDDKGQTTFKYTTSNGVVIKGNDVTVDSAVAVPANFQMQLASFINPNGLIAQGGNTYSKGANCGDAFFGTPGTNGFGTMQSGALESSNVDMTKQFADMIVAQRAIEANSRVFDSQNQIMRTLVNLGQ